MSASKRVSPRRWGRFEILDRLGSGGAGTVFRVRDPQREGEFALKLLESADPRAQKRFAREAAALERLDHPHIVRTFESGVEAGRPYLLLELLPGATLADLLARGPLHPRQAAQLVARIAEAVAHAHAQNVLHRDLKPENVLLDAADRPRLTDFGLTRDVELRASQTRLSQEGVILGTPQYWAPEQARGDVAACGTHTDVYGLGALLFAALTAQAPHTGKTLLELVARAQDPPRAPSALVPGVDATLDALCRQAMAPDPIERPPSASALAASLRDYLARGPTTRRARPVGRAPLVVAALLVGAGWLAAGVVFLSRSGPAPRAAESTTSSPADASPSPTPTTGTPTPEAPDEGVVLDAASLRDLTRLAALEAREPWGVSLSEDAILLRGHPCARPELRLPLRLDGGPFLIEARLSLDAWEGSNELDLWLQREEQKAGLELTARTQELYDTRTIATGVHNRSGRDFHLSGLNHGEPFAVEAPLLLRLRYAPEAGLFVSVQHGQDPPLELQMAEPGELGRGHHWLRLGLNLFTDPEKGLVGDVQPTNGRDSSDAARVRLTALRIVQDSPLLLDTEGLTLGPLNTGGRAGRRLVAGQDLPALIEDLRALTNGLATPSTSHNLGALLLLLPLAQLAAGQPEDAAQSIRNALFLVSNDGLQELSQPNARWYWSWTSAWPSLNDDQRRVFAAVEAEGRKLGQPEEALEVALDQLPLAETGGVRDAALVSLLLVHAGELTRDYPEAVAKAEAGCTSLERARDAWWTAAERVLGDEVYAGVAAYRVHDMAGAVRAWEAAARLPRTALTPEMRDLLDYATETLLPRARALSGAR